MSLNSSTANQPISHSPACRNVCKANTPHEHLRYRKRRSHPNTYGGLFSHLSPFHRFRSNFGSLMYGRERTSLTGISSIEHKGQKILAPTHTAFGPLPFIHGVTLVSPSHSEHSHKPNSSSSGHSSLRVRFVMLASETTSVAGAEAETCAEDPSL
ncbi:hypothetical protein K458DRAFT_417141 [Lentithecium fluviatile CBS 122367]|uniref:Uncharacterized protein n=1 Tax=Lentithecium fluviatile CBS 122367 TaxID=1168545 RepID=A0A6G1J3Q3_9PLEO|nr:hypothetical protein K458DRAFT_417141 [Lentithecium fluviatile CBS 122367]